MCCAQAGGQGEPDEGGPGDAARQPPDVRRRAAGHPDGGNSSTPPASHGSHPLPPVAGAGVTPAVESTASSAWQGK